MNNYETMLKKQMPEISLNEKQMAVIKALDAIPAAGGKTFLIKVLSVLESNMVASRAVTVAALIAQGIRVERGKNEEIQN